jgi:hypothetical protein
MVCPHSLNDIHNAIIEDSYTLVVIQDPNYVEPVVSKIVASEDGAESVAE